MLALCSTVILSWYSANTNVVFNVYEQTFAYAAPVWTNGKPVSPMFTITPNWTKVTTTTKQSVSFVTQSDNRVHCYRVTAQDSKTLLESGNALCLSHK